MLRKLPPVENDSYPIDFPDDYTRFLKSICEFGRYQNIVEVGVQFGSTTIRLCEAAKFTNGKVFGYDIFEKIGNYGDDPNVKKDAVERRLREHGIDDSRFKITKINSRDDNFAEVVKNDTGGSIDFLFIDADHSYDGVKNDFFKLYPMLSNDGTVVFHDTFNHTGVRQFILDLRTKYNDGTFDLINFPFGYCKFRCGVALLTKRANHIYPWDMVWDPAPSDTPRIEKPSLYEAEMAWMKNETQNKSIQ